MTTTMSQNELSVVQLLIEHNSCSIADLEGYLNVTATAVRQRLNRLLAAGLIDRSTESHERGRPTHRYWLTVAGQKLAGNNLADFAEALWHEIHQIPDESIRRAIMNGAVNRLAANYTNQVSGRTLGERLNSIATLFKKRDIPVAVAVNGGQPTLTILACPYPELANDNHEICEMEKQLFSQVVGGTVELRKCRRDGDSCCSFQAGSE